MIEDVEVEIEATLNREIISNLTKIGFIGQVHPTFKNSLDPVIMALLVPFNNALDEAKVIRKDLTKNQLVKIFKTYNIAVFNSIEDFMKIKENIKKGTIPTRLVKEYKTRLEEIADKMGISKQRIRYNHTLDQVVMEGKNGCLYTDENWWYLFITAKSKRQWSSYKTQLSFMKLINDGDIEGRFKSQSPTTPGEAKIIRKVVGFKKSRKTVDH